MADLVRHLDRRRFHPVAVYHQDQQFARELAEAGFEVHIWEREPSGSLRDVPNRSAGRKAVEQWKTVRERVRFLRGLQIELFHANNAPHKGYLDWLPAATIAGIPALTHARGPYFPPSSLPRRWLTRSWKCVVAISRFIERDLLVAGFPRRRIRTVFDGVDVGRFTDSVSSPREDVRRRLGILPEHFVVLMVGNVKRWKGQSVVLDALSLLGGDLKHRTRLLFTGDVSHSEASSSYYDELQRIITDRCLVELVTFLGRRDDVPNLMNAADVVVHASTRPEPFGLVVVEAMALGKPVIAAKDGGPAEILIPGSGLTFDTRKPEQLTEALRRLHADPDLRASLAAGARQRVRHFTIERTVRAVEALYAELLGLRRLPSTDMA